MSTIDFTEKNELFGGNWDRPHLGLGIESEQIQRAAKSQIMNFLPEISDQVENVWMERDKVYAETIKGSYKKLRLPQVKKENFFTGGKHSQIIEQFPLEIWPFIVIYSHDAKPYMIQEDQFDTFTIPLFVEVMCSNGPVFKEEELHTREGIELMVELDSIVQRLSDAVHLCIKKDPTIGGVAGSIEKPPVVKQCLPWARKEVTKIATGEWYIFQGKQFEYQVQHYSA
jgi:hypothetical protein